MRRLLIIVVVAVLLGMWVNPALAHQNSQGNAAQSQLDYQWMTLAAGVQVCPMNVNGKRVTAGACIVSGGPVNVGGNDVAANRGMPIGIVGSGYPQCYTTDITDPVCFYSATTAQIAPFEVDMK